VGIAMVGLDARYTLKGFQARGQWIYSAQSNTGAYNAFTKSDLGSGVTGYYLEAAYNLLRHFKTTHQLTPFVRFEHYNTHQQVEAGTTRQSKYLVNEWVAGLGWKPAEGAVFKVDVRLKKSAADTSTTTPYLNAGIGVWF